MIYSKDPDHWIYLENIAKEVESFKKDKSHSDYEMNIGNKFAEALINFEAIKCKWNFLILLAVQKNNKYLSLKGNSAIDKKSDFKGNKSRSEIFNLHKEEFATRLEKPKKELKSNKNEESK